MKLRRLRKVRVHAARVSCSLAIQAGALLLGALGCSKNDPDGLAPSTARPPAERAHQNTSPKETSIPESSGVNRLEDHQLKVSPDAKAGPCGCSADETCVVERLKVDEVREETRYKCVTTPSSCSPVLRCECATFCAAEMACRLGGQAGVIQCSTKMGP